MSSVKEQLLEDMMEAMEEKDTEKLSVIRMARATIKNAEIHGRKDLSNGEVIEVLFSELKMRCEAREEYARLGKRSEALRLDREIEVLMNYVPPQAKSQEMEDLAHAVIEELGAKDTHDLGRVMGAVMPRVQGRINGMQVSAMVKEILGK